MSVKVMNLVWKTALEPTAKLVLLALADNADQDGKCWPSVPTIMRKSGASRRTVQRALLDLEIAGHLSRNQILGRGCEYRIHPRHNDTPPNRARGRQCGTPPASERHPTRATVTREGRHSDAQTIIEPPLNRQEPSKTRARGASGVDGQPIDAAMADFREHRRKLKAPLTRRAEELILAKLEKLRATGHDPAAVLEQSIERGWKGVFPLKLGNGGRADESRNGLFDASRE